MPSKNLKIRSLFSMIRKAINFHGFRTCNGTIEVQIHAKIIIFAQSARGGYGVVNSTPTNASMNSDVMIGLLQKRSVGGRINATQRSYCAGYQYLSTMREGNGLWEMYRTA